ncbi:hypothetical protein Dvina_17115 [Dactylosporangium vinaceum]|uniref:Transcriptional regulator n=1 Tax=Dactylosporangium vinaceum TaxID=53362 RepID=A0ABV5MK91_9ACTN|nr:hypothetical protein [Dactylosporangium vinaceum]UAB99635.1 hypothetical protein Dvina_17115 [Dactylosporangium vinaceum]
MTTYEPNRLDLLAEAVIPTATTPRQLLDAGVHWLLHEDAAELWLSRPGRADGTSRLTMLAGGFAVHHASAVLRCSGYEPRVECGHRFDRSEPLAVLRRGDPGPMDWSLYRAIYRSGTPTRLRVVPSSMIEQLREAARGCDAVAHPLPGRSPHPSPGESPGAERLVLCARANRPDAWFATGQALSQLRIRAALAGFSAQIAELLPDRRRFGKDFTADEQDIPAATLRIVAASRSHAAGD